MAREKDYLALEAVYFTAPTKANLEALRAWFEAYGDRYWNGEAWYSPRHDGTAGGYKITPEWIITRDGDREVRGYTLEEV